MKFLPLIPKPIQRTWFFIVNDFLLSLFVLYISHYLAYVNINYKLIIYMSFVNVFCIFLFKGYKVVWRFFSLYETKDIILALLSSHFVLTLVSLFYNIFSTRAILINFVIYLLLVIVLRFSKRIYLEFFSKRQADDKSSIIFIGIGNITQALIKDYKKKYKIKAIIDTDNTLKNNHISNIIVRPLLKLNSILEDSDKIVITLHLEVSILNQIFTIASSHNISDIQIIKSSLNDDYKLSKISIEDLLARMPKDFDKQKTSSFIKDKTILITGAGGSIGQEIVRQCVYFKANRVLLLDHSEYNLYTAGQMLNEIGFKNYKLFLKNVTHIKSLEEVFINNKIDIAIHAAAYKHVGIVEENIKDSLTNNIIGTKNCIDFSIKYKLDSFVLISTDKAIRPTSIMGASKRICELYAQNIDSKHTKISSVRFGNVLNSSGSVIPKFKSQIDKNQPLTVTHKDITRYFMLISEACELTLQSASMSNGSEVFILDMGEPIKIVDLANKMLWLYNKKHLGIKFVGLGQGEKLYEELLLDESDKKTQYDSIIIAKNTIADIEKLKLNINSLVNTTDNNKIMSLIKTIVPEYARQDY